MLRMTMARQILVALLSTGAVLVGCGDDEDNLGGGGTTGSTTSTATQASTSASTKSATTATTASASTTASVSSSTGGAAWQAPACAAIMGTNAVTFTSDEGATLAPTPGQLQGTVYTSVVALDTPNRLLATAMDKLLSSSDAGCTWTEVATLQGAPFKLTAAAGGRAYAWQDNGDALYRLDGDVPTLLDSPLPNIVGLGVDRGDGLHIRIGDASGVQQDSIDGGVTWTKQGISGAAGDLVLGYRMAYDPSDIDHVFFGQATEGAQVSEDGGVTWNKALGLGQSAQAFSIAVSPLDSNIVWIEGFQNGPDIRHVYRSSDGGHNFTPVVDGSAEINLYNGNLLVPHPTDANVLYFVFGMSFQGYGTDIYRYDHATGMVTKTHNDYHDVWSIVPSPADPEILYLSLVNESK